jgi:hypothetical protein
LKGFRNFLVSRYAVKRMIACIDSRNQDGYRVRLNEHGWDLRDVVTSHNGKKTKETSLDMKVFHEVVEAEETRSSSFAWVVILSGDGDLVEAAKYAHLHGKMVHVIASRESMSERMKSIADRVDYIEDMMECSRPEVDGESTDSGRKEATGNAGPQKAAPSVGRPRDPVADQMKRANERLHAFLRAKGGRGSINGCIGIIFSELKISRLADLEMSKISQLKTRYPMLFEGIRFSDPCTLEVVQ